MPDTSKPRSGSMQFWPRKKASRAYARVRSWSSRIKDCKPLGFAGYKVGMTHVTFIDNRTNSMTKGSEVPIPVTIVDCPPIKILSLRFYKKQNNALKPVSEVISAKVDKELARKISVPKKVKKKIEDIKEFDEIRIIVHTQPKLTGIGKKKPEIFEIALSGAKEDQLKFAKESLGKELLINNMFQSGNFIDAHSITKGKGYQGAVKRFGIGLKSHKSEKGRRTPGSLGGWKGQGHFMYRVAHAGQTGYHQRTDYNNQVITIVEDPKQINPKSGFKHYGTARNPCILIKGSVPGPSKRLIIMTHAIRPDPAAYTGEFSVNYIKVK